MGAVLHRGGATVAWWAVRLEEADAARLGILVGESAGVSVLEALAILIAVRTWGTLTNLLEVRSDSAVGLAALCKLTTCKAF